MSFGDLSPHDDASTSCTADSLAGHIFPEVQQSSLHPADDSSSASFSAGRGHAAASVNSRNSSNSMLQRRFLNSHPIQVTGEDIERSLSELDLGLFLPTAESAGLSFAQTSQTSSRQQSAKQKPSNKRPSFSSASAGKTGQISSSTQHINTKLYHACHSICKCM